MKRQEPCGPWFLDFLFPEAMLVVELDGYSHDSAAGVARDVERDDWLASRGYRVLRFANRELLDNLDGVVATIAAALGDPSPRPSPKGEGEEN